MITEEKVREQLKTVADPELGIDIVTLGLIYGIRLGPVGADDERHEWIEVTMTLTSPFCPFGEKIIEDVENAVNLLGAGEARVEITFDPPWQPSVDLKRELGI